MPYNFDEQNEKGKAGEKIVMDYFDTVLKKEVFDVSSDPTYFSEGIDFIIKESNASVEVKTDLRNSNDLIIEVVNSVRYNTEGWIYKTGADWIAFYKAHHKKIYMIKSIELKVLNHLISMYQPIAVAKDSFDKKHLDYGICKAIDIPSLNDCLDKKDFIVFDLAE